MNRNRAGLLAATILLSAAPVAAQNRIFYVDYDHGDDAADGLSPSTAWKHAPGDSKAAGAPRRAALLPGDNVRFRGGVRYRGSILPVANGSPEAPVVLDGSSWGPLRAVFDGSQPLSGVRRCKSAADCLGNAYWRNLWRADLPATASWSDWLFVNDKALQPAQYPATLPEEADKPEKFLPIPQADLGQLQAGRIRHSLPAELERGQPVLALWVDPNLIAFTADARVSTAGVDFPDARWVNAGFRPYTNRDNRFSILNAPAMVNRAGLFAMSPADGVAIFWPAAAGGTALSSASAAPSVSTGGRRLGINGSKANHMLVRGFSFTSYASMPGNMSTGAAILSRSQNSGIRIANNSFRSIVGVGGPAAIHIAFARALTVEHNEVVDTPWTTGILVDHTVGPVAIRCNRLANIGHTGIRFNNVANGDILGNSLTRVNSVHGNAISAYNDSRNVRIMGNVVTASIRPLTLLGTSKPYFTSGTPGVTVSDNVFIGSGSVNGAITSYGLTPNLVITGNFLYSHPNALKIAGTETGFVATGNQLVGAVVQPKNAQLFSAEGNSFHDPEGNGALLVEQMRQAKPPAGYCD